MEQLPKGRKDKEKNNNHRGDAEDAELEQMKKSINRPNHHMKGRSMNAVKDRVFSLAGLSNFAAQIRAAKCLFVFNIYSSFLGVLSVTAPCVTLPPASMQSCVFAVKDFWFSLRPLRLCGEVTV